MSPTAPQAVPDAGATPVVLIVDDDPLVFEGLRRRLRRHPLALLSAGNGQEALRVIAEHDVDVVVTDENMPTMPGLALLGVLADEHPEIVRVMMTGNPRASIAIGAINRGRVFRFLLKPFDALDLVEILKGAMAERQRRAAESRIVELAAEQCALLRSLEPAGGPPSPTTLPTDRPPLRSAAPQPAPGADVLDALSASERDQLTKREAEVVRCLAEGQRVNDVAAGLSISRHTVRNHLRSVFSKLGVRSQQELLRKLLG